MKYDTEKIKKFVETLDMPSWGYISNVEIDKWGVIKITFCKFYHIDIDTKCKASDSVYNDADCAWSYRGLEFALNILDERDEILKMVED